jgi:hypothetical protein
LSDKPILEELLEVQEHFLPGPALVEKDWHVVRALAAIAASIPATSAKKIAAPNVWLFPEFATFPRKLDATFAAVQRIQPVA